MSGERNDDKKFLFSKSSNLINIIPDDLFRYLPFSKQSIRELESASDISNFLYVLHNKGGTIVAEDGTISDINYAVYGDFVYERGLEKFTNWAKIFAELASEAKIAPAAAEKKINIPNFMDDVNFGAATKYFIAWDGVIGEVLSESAFYSLPHILESEEDLNSSLLLAANLFYKQAMQSIRSFIENLILPIFFCENPKNYIKWKSDNYRTPSLRGDKGVLVKLFKKGLITNEEKQKTSDIYGELNSFIHSSEGSLNHSGLFSNEWTGHVFNYDSFSLWADCISKSISLGVRLVKINIQQWERVSQGGGMICLICHGTNKIVDKEFEFGNRSLITYKCQQCGNKITISVG